MTATLTSPGRRRQPAPRYLAAIASGVFLSAAFPPIGARWLVFVALVPLFWACTSPRLPIGPSPAEAPDGCGGPPIAARGGASPAPRTRFLLGFTCAIVFFLLLLHWILFLSNEEITVPGLMFPALLFMAAYLAVFFGAAAALAGWLERGAGVSGAAMLAVTWPLLDHLRSIGQLAFPWGSLGYALAPHPAALQMASLAGYWVLPFWILSVNALLAAALGSWEARLAAALPGEGRARCPGRVLPRIAAAVAVAVVPWLGGALYLAGHPENGHPAVAGTASERPAHLRVVLVQPNTPREIKWRPGFEHMVIDDLLVRTETAARTEADLIIWPETSAPLVLTWRPELERKVSQTVERLQTWVLVGTLDAIQRPGGVHEAYNAAILYNPDGMPVQRYYKTHLVPFSEAMPFHDEAPWLGVLNFGQSDFSKGGDQELFRAAGWSFGCLICFESIFPEIARAQVRKGAHYLVNTTNDFWFGRSAGPRQHAEMAVLRAVENRTPLARCANTGISFFVDPWGRVSQATPTFVPAEIRADLPPGRGGSLYTRLGDWIIAALWAIVLATGASAMAGRIAWRRATGSSAGIGRWRRSAAPAPGVSGERT